MPDPTAAQALEIARRHHSSGNLREAEMAYRQALAANPLEPDALHLLGVLANQVGHREIAVDLIRQAIAIRRAPEYFSNLGFILRETGQFDEAIAACSEAAQINPRSHEAHNNLGFALQGAARWDEAIAAFSTASQLQPAWTVPLINLAQTYRAIGRYRDALQAMKRVLAITGPDAVALNDLGVMLQANQQLDEATDAFREALRLAPEIPEIHNNLGNALQDAAHVTKAIACFRRAVELNPNFTVAHSNLLYAMHFDPAADPATLLQEHRNWSRVHAEPLTQTSMQPALRDTNQRRLRIAYLSRDLRDHPVGRFLLPILEAHDRTKFEIVCYADTTEQDDISRRLRAQSDAWHVVESLSDASLAETIRAHGIDVLFDLAAHAPGNRVLVFARRPAPLQITYLGYPGTTGMPAMDLRVTDSYLDPPGVNDAHYSERSARPASTYWCYAPIPDAPSVGPLPALNRGGRIRFGCLNNFGKINPTLLQTWARLLRAVPESRILLHAPQGRCREDVLKLLGSNRVEFIGRQAMRQYLDTYNTIDIALDPFPYHGGTTTCDALWMGVPVVTLAGKLAVHRAGVSILSNVGLPELIAGTPDEYVDRAVGLSADLPALEAMRRSLREMMSRSPLCDAMTFTRGLEALLQREIATRYTASL